jgi:uncharacterized protein YjbI with pentapeptide repeats
VSPSCRANDAETCRAVVMPDSEFCFAHGSRSERSRTLDRWIAGAQLNAESCRISPDLLDELFDRCQLQNGKPVLDNVNFRRARFLETCTFRRCRIGSGVTFIRAFFENRVSFRDCRVESGVDFTDADFHRTLFGNTDFGHTAKFGGCRFHGVDFGGAHFENDAVFWRSTFDGSAPFGGSRFGDDANFVEARFLGDVRFEGAVFGARADFSRAAFDDLAVFDGTAFGDGLTVVGIEALKDFTLSNCRIGDEAVFRNSRFAEGLSLSYSTHSGSLSLSGIDVVGDLDLSNATFTKPADLDRVDCRRLLMMRSVMLLGMRVSESRMSAGLDAGNARFHGPAYFQSTHISGERAVLDGISFPESVVLTISSLRLQCRSSRFLGGGRIDLDGPVRVDLGSAGLPAPFVLTSRDANWPGQIVSLHQADVTGLALYNVSLRSCMLRGALNVEKMRVDNPSTAFRRAPRRIGRQRFSRLTIADEHQWRIENPTFLRAGRRWTLSERSSQDGVTGEGDPTPESLVGVYRSLRKCREDGKDEPGAADFYFGEMLMRMHSPGKPAERLIVVLYWLLAGFGLRASRAFMALFAVSLMMALTLHTIGFVQPVPDRLNQVLLFVVSPAFTRDQQVYLTTAGAYLVLVFRFAQAVLLGLGLLAIRGRVKRN